MSKLSNTEVELKKALLIKKACSQFRLYSGEHGEQSNYHCVKSVGIWSCSSPYFPAFGLNTERYGVSLRIQSECGKIRTRTTSNTDTFHPVQRNIFRGIYRR